MHADLNCLHVYNNNSLVSLTHLYIYIYIVCFSVSGHPPLSGPSSRPFRRSSSVPAHLFQCQLKDLFLDAAVVSFIYVLYYFITEMNLKIFEYFDIYARVA